MIKAPRKRCRAIRDPEANALHNVEGVAEDELDLEPAREPAHQACDPVKVVVGVVGEPGDLAFWQAEAVLENELHEDRKRVVDGLSRARVVGVWLGISRVDERWLRDDVSERLRDEWRERKGTHVEIGRAHV